MQLITQTFYEGIFALGDSDLHLNVSCVYTSTSTTKSATNHSSRRLTFDTPQSVLYYIEHLANNTQSNATFLTLLREERRTRLSFGVTDTARNNSLASTKENELTFTDNWLFVAVIIGFVYVCYSPAIFLLFRPSEVTVMVVRKTRKKEKYPTMIHDQETAEDDDGCTDIENHEGHTPIENVHVGNEMDPYPKSDNLYHDSGSVSDTEEGVFSFAAVEFETEYPTDQNSKMVIARRRTDKVVGQTNTEKEPGQERKVRNGKADTENLEIRLGRKHDVGVSTEDSPSPSSEFTTIYTELSTIRIAALTSDEPLDGPTEADRIARLSSGDVASTSIDSSATSRNDKELSGSDRNVGSNDSADSRHHIIDIWNDNPLYICPPSLHAERGSHDEEKETVPAIIVGGTYPVGLGSFIGNSLFSTMDKNKLCKAVKFVFIFVVPFLIFTGFGDLLLKLVPNLHSKLASHLPFPFLTSSVFNGIITNHPIVIYLVVFSGICYFSRLHFCVCYFPTDPLDTWTPCSVHRMHPTCFVFERINCLFCNVTSICNSQLYERCLSVCPCKECKELPPLECRKYLDLPENILHNLEKQPDIFVKYWDSFVQWSENMTIASFFMVLCFPLVLVALVIDIFFSSPLVCLCHGRQWMLKKHFKNKFKGSKFILPILDFLHMLFSLVWVIFFLLSSAIPLGVATTGLIISLANNTNEVLPHLTIVILVLHYVWSCYMSFRTPFRDLAKILYSSYQKKFDELEKRPEMNHVLIHYKQEGPQGDHVKVIPKELFHDGCIEYKLKPRKQVALLFLKLGLTLLALSFVYPIISSNVSSDADASTSNVITFLVVAYIVLNNAITGWKLDVSEEEADKTVDGFIKRKQDLYTLS